MNILIAKQWAERLRSGQHKQGWMKLTVINEDKSESDCCLGVLCKMAVEAGVVTRVKHDVDHFFNYGKTDDEEDANYLPKSVLEWAGMHSRMGKYNEDFNDSLSSKNDDGATFEEIAGLIEAKANEL